MRWVFTCLLALVLASCAGETGQRMREPQPVGDASAFESFLDGAMRAAEPQGVIMVVVWTTETPPPEWLGDLTEHWKRYGLVPIGICADLLKTDSSGEQLARVRKWESDQRLDFPSLIYNGDVSTLSDRLGGERTPASMTLLSEHGTVIWFGDGFDHEEKVQSLLQLYLGEPSVAGFTGL